MPYVIPNTPELTNPTGNSVGVGNSGGTQSSALRIDDNDISLRKTWSSAKLNSMVDGKQDDEKTQIIKYRELYGDLYFVNYDWNSRLEWQTVINDATMAIRRGESFYIAWSENRMCQVVDANAYSNNQLTVLFDGLFYATSPEGMQEVVTSERLGKVRIGTTAEWREKPTFVPEKGEIIIFSDRNFVDGTYYPGIKIGDGLAFNLDLPFVGDDFAEEIMARLDEHVHDMVMHVTQEEKDFWNAKLNCHVNGEELIFNRM